MPAALALPVSRPLQADLAIAAMNRGHAHLLRGSPATLLEAHAEYGEAIELLRPLITADPQPGWGNSLGAALMNRGQLTHRLHGLERAADALADFGEAARLLKAITSTTPWPRRNLAGVFINRANLLLDLERPADAAHDAREARHESVATARTELVDADLTLKAARVLCDALGQLVVTTGADQESLARDASDTVDEALELARHWAARGTTIFHPLVQRLLVFGLQLYRFHQPHFLAEFIRENVPLADPDTLAVVRTTIDAALDDQLLTGRYLTIGDPITERRLQTCRDLEAVRSQLSAR